MNAAKRDARNAAVFQSSRNNMILHQNGGVQGFEIRRSAHIRNQCSRAEDINSAWAGFMSANPQPPSYQIRPTGPLYPTATLILSFILFTMVFRMSAMSCRVATSVLLSICWLSEKASAHPAIFADGNKPHLLRRDTQVLSAEIVAIIIGAIVLILVVAVLLVCCYRKRSRSDEVSKRMSVALPIVGQAPPIRPFSGTMRRDGDWWQPTADGGDDMAPHVPKNAPYSQGGHGYTYGSSLRPASASTMVGTRTSVFSNARSSVHSHVPQVTEAEPERPYQIPVASPPPPPSISPSYHSHVSQDQNGIRLSHTSSPAQSSLVYTPPTYIPSISFQPRPDIPAPLQPQATGTSMYSSPYEVSAMTKSTSGHPGT